MKMKTFYFLLSLLALNFAGCVEKVTEEDNTPTSVMSKVEVKNGNNIIEQRDYSYNNKFIRTGEKTLVTDGNGSSISDAVYNSDANIVDLEIIRNKLDGTLVSSVKYNFVYDYSKSTLIINKNSKKKYELFFWDGSDIKKIKEEKYQILMTYLKNIEDGYALELSYLKTPVEFSCNIKEMIKTAVIYDDLENKTYKIEYSDKNKIFKETKTDRKFEYTYESNVKIVKKEFDNFDGVIGTTSYNFEIDKKGYKTGLLINNSYIWKKTVYYNDGSNVLREIFNSDVLYFKTNLGNYEKNYNYVNNQLSTITIDYRQNSTSLETGLYTLDLDNRVTSYNDGTKIKRISYNGDGTVFKYEYISTNDVIKSITSMTEVNK